MERCRVVERRKIVHILFFFKFPVCVHLTRIYCYMCININDNFEALQKFEELLIKGKRNRSFKLGWDRKYWYSQDMHVYFFSILYHFCAVLKFYSIHGMFISPTFFFILALRIFSYTHNLLFAVEKGTLVYV